jgi:hypothetical protein
MGLVDVIVNLNGVPEKLEQKAADLSMIIYGRTNTMLLSTQEIVQGVTPQGEGCPGAEYPGGNLRAAIKHIVTGNGGMVYVDNEQAPYVDWAIKRGPVKAKNAKALHFCVGGRDIYRKSVGPVNKPDFFMIGYAKATPEILNQANMLGESIIE